MLLSIFSPFSLGKTDIEGSFLVRSLITPQNLGASSNNSQLYLKGNFHPSNELKVQTHFLFSQFYGELPPALENSIEIYPSASWLIHPDIQLKLGRNLYDNPFHQIVSSNLYNKPFQQIVSSNPYETRFYSFDGAFLEYSTSILNLNIWSAQLPKKWQGLKQVQAFKYGLGFFLDIKFTENYIESFNFHVAYLADSLSQNSAERMSRYGLALKGLIQPIHLNYTFIAIGHGSGFQFKMEENMYHFELDYSRPDFFNSRFFTGYHTDSSQYDPWLYDRYENAGFSDIFLWGNLSYYFVGLSLSPLNRLDIKIKFYDFKPTEKGSINLGYIGTRLQRDHNSSISVSKNKLGQELDLQINTKISKEFQIRLTTVFFFPLVETKNFLKNKKFYNNILLAGLFKF